jgi:hypothetical protein
MQEDIMSLRIALARECDSRLASGIERTVTQSTVLHHLS